ncbi:peptidoglycan DD-metalloendopeptidase family protein [uncultured Maricaulis sp.]|uniref:peptidoglycan DD-metalloendopeptidase family protein n=1 Tax=uncultured Maricaulis sp. TaxID=174710 RepID=UPI0030DDBB8A|tara:strand:- start:49318 stop:50553 length:1236 start_codon:yes stop_codon:yes gene_type:complete
MLSRLKLAVWGTAQRWFPDRQIYHRSDGQVRYFAISTAVQISALLSAAVLACWLCYSTVSVAFHGQALAAKDAEIQRERINLNRMVAEAQASEATAYSFMESRMEEFDRAAYEFQMRHETLSQLVEFAEQLSGNEMTPSPALDNDRVLMAATPADPTPRMARDPLINVAAMSDSPEDQISYLMGEQDNVLAEAEDVTEARLENLRAVLRLTGLDIDHVVANGHNGEEQGGPFIPISDTQLFSNGSHVEPEFSSRISRVAARMLEVEELERFIETGPLGIPVSVPYRRTSRFGVRLDPFTRRPTGHRGVDFAAYRGAPIVATGPGRVVYAGWRNGFGRTVEIDHGYGFMTRYGHMNAIVVRRGDTVERGQQVGEMGTTGRSTGTHVHYEIWYEGSAIDPDRLLRAGQYVQQG